MGLGIAFRDGQRHGAGHRGMRSHVRCGGPQWRLAAVRSNLQHEPRYPGAVDGSAVRQAGAALHGGAQGPAAARFRVTKILHDDGTQPQISRRGKKFKIDIDPLSGEEPRRTLAIMIAAFGLDQIIGPVVAGYGSDLTGSFLLLSLLAAVALCLSANLTVKAGEAEAITAL